jgi:hypothetical protein
MPDYKKAIIYKIFKMIDDKELCYVGSTTNLNVRKTLHNSQSFHRNSLLYKTIRENGGFDTWTMEKIKDYPCETKIQLRMEEERCIKEFANLNMVCAFITPEDARVKYCKYLKDKYANNEEYKAKQLDNANNRYANDEIYRLKTIERSKKRYLNKIDLGK